MQTAGGRSVYSTACKTIGQDSGFEVRWLERRTSWSGIAITRQSDVKWTGMRSQRQVKVQIATEMNNYDKFPSRDTFEQVRRPHGSGRCIQLCVQIDQIASTSFAVTEIHILIILVNRLL